MTQIMIKFHDSIEARDCKHFVSQEIGKCIQSKNASNSDFNRMKWEYKISKLAQHMCQNNSGR